MSPSRLFIGLVCPMRQIAWKQVAWLLTLAGIVRLGAALYWHPQWCGQFVLDDNQGCLISPTAPVAGDLSRCPRVASLSNQFLEMESLPLSPNA